MLILTITVAFRSTSTKQCGWMVGVRSGQYPKERLVLVHERTLLISSDFPKTKPLGGYRGRAAKLLPGIGNARGAREGRCIASALGALPSLVIS